MEAAPVIPNQETAPQPDLLEILGDREITIFGITGTFNDLAKICTEDLNDPRITTEDKNEFVVKAANEAEMEIEPQLEEIFTHIIEKHGLEQKFRVAEAGEKNPAVQPHDAPEQPRKTEAKVDRMPDKTAVDKQESVDNARRIIDTEHLEPQRVAAAAALLRDMATKIVSHGPEGKPENRPASKATIPEVITSLEQTLKNPQQKESSKPVLQEGAITSVPSSQSSFETDQAPLPPVNKDIDVITEVFHENTDRFDSYLRIAGDEVQPSLLTPADPELEIPAAEYQPNDSPDLLESAEVLDLLNLFEETRIEDSELHRLHTFESVLPRIPQEILPELPTPIEQVETAFLELTVAFEAAEEGQRAKINDILEEIVSLPEIIDELSLPKAEKDEIIEQQLEELVMVLFDEAGIGYTSELATSFAKIMRMQFCELSSEKITPEESPTSGLPKEVGTREFLQKLHHDLKALKQAMRHFYEIGRSALRLYGLSTLAYTTSA